MTVLRYLFRRLRALWRSEEDHDEISEEIRFHIELRAENVRRKKRGAWTLKRRVS